MGGVPYIYIYIYKNARKLFVLRFHLDGVAQPTQTPEQNMSVIVQALFVFPPELSCDMLNMRNPCKALCFAALS